MGGVDGARRYSGTAARDELRWRRRRAILATALDILTRDGYEALTMQRIADALECGVASIYRLFPSKDAMIAELQLDALELLQTSWDLGREHLEVAMVDAGLDDAAKALTRALGAGWFWVAAEARFPHEIEMARKVIVDRSTVVPPDQSARILTTSLEMFDRGRSALAGAVDAGVLEPGNDVERAIVIIATVFGIAVTANFSRWDLQLFDGERLAGEAVCGHLVAWGADRAAVAAAAELLRAEMVADRLAPPAELPEGERSL